MLNLIAAAAFFLLIHLFVSGTRLRDVLTARIGQGPYMGLFALASLAGLAWLGIAFALARGGPGDAVLWDATPTTRWIQLGLTLIAFLFIVIGLATPNPTSVRQEGVLERDDAVRGMLRITRHPFLWGVAIWAAGHLMVNGDVASLVLFGSLLILALFGTASIDAKRKRALGEKWNAFAARTSAVPFAAIASNRQSLRPGEIGWRLPLLAVVVWAALLWLHPYAFGVSPLPV